jgi:hypothetical protein
MKSDEIFKNEVKSNLQPKLFSLGFERIKIKENWIYPTFLYEHNDIWFGTSWDWRDNYLEIDLGRLFFFKDVLPRVIIIGTINIDDMPSSESKQFEGYEKYFQGIFTKVSAGLDEKVRLFDVQYPEAFEKRTEIDESISKKEKQYRRIFVEHLGKQLKRADIPCN